MLGAIDRADTNAVCSPLSAQIVLTMAGMGAAGATRAQMEQTLGGSMDQLAEAANTLAGALLAVGEQQRQDPEEDQPDPAVASLVNGIDRKSTRLNSSHVAISYAVFCLKNKRHYTVPGHDDT